MVKRNPLVDPHKGDVVRFLNKEEEVALVRKIELDDPDPDPLLGPQTVTATVDNKYGSRRCSTMALETWRNCAKDGEVCWHA